MDEAWNARDGAALESLCGQFGIATSYNDVWGTRRTVARDALLALLAEFGLRLGQPQSVHEALATAQAARSREALPPVLAIQDSHAQWAIRLHIDPTARRLQLRLLDEDGRQVHCANIDARALDQGADSEHRGNRLVERKLTIDRRLAAGYYRLSIDGVDGETLVICAPAQCYRSPSVQDGGRVWGLALQLYALRSAGNWGIGDFGDLATLVRQMAALGADIIGLNPLHALFAHNPAHASPYSPSSRQQLNVLYIDVPAIDDFARCAPARHLVESPEFQQRLARLRAAPLVDYPGVASAKFEVLELLFAFFTQQHLGFEGAANDASGREFLDFIEKGGAALRRHALFETIQGQLHAADSAVWGWPAWPAPLRDPAGSAVQEFARAHDTRVRFHMYLQWQAARQLARAHAVADTLGMGIGLYQDLAVSVDRGGSDAWGEQDCFAVGASVGAPPDEFNPNGQGWGLPPLRPDRLRVHRYRIFIETLRSNMRDCGALRIDHVMGLMRLFWIPGGRSPRDGAYVHYALDEMMAIVALESQRNRCMVIGEDLGTVADEMRAALASADVLSYRLLYFERQIDGGFKPPRLYPAAALAAVSTHDLATLAGWWAGHDLQQRLALGLFPHEDLFEKQLLDRALDRMRLLLALRHAGFIDAAQLVDAAASGELAPATIQAIHAFLAAAPSAVMIVQLEDALGVREQVNMPSTVDEHPNWRRKLPLELRQLEAHAALQGLGAMLSTIRPRSARENRSAPQARVPRATYRLQFHKGFGFDDAVGILPYLARLGVSHVYCSPIHRARSGSTHGYDVVAHDEINPELGGPEAFARFCAALKAHGMGQLLDMVPNHMGVLGGDNAWWSDVLENGPSSLFAQHFDIDWNPLNRELTGKVLLPVLGNHYGDVLMAGELELRLQAESGSFALQYFDHRFPIAPETYPLLVLPAQARLQDPDLAESLASIASAFGHLPARDAQIDATRQERARDKELLKARLARLVARHAEVALAIAATVAEVNVEPERAALHALTEAQAFRLAFWRVAADEINYRRFFDINELAALRMERPEVFEATQSMALDLAARGIVDGLRIDHPDGLYDPAGYFSQLQQAYAKRTGQVLPAAGSDGRPARPLYVVVEKIAATHEEIPLDWAIHGTTGYRFANIANGVLVDTDAGAHFSHIWRNFSGESRSFEALAREGKRDIMRAALASELQVLSTELLRIARADLRTRDYTHNELRRALAEVAANMPVYRSYVVDQPSEQDRRYIEWAVTDAEHHSQDADLSIFGFVRQSLLAQALPGSSDALREQVRRFARRFQQYSAPVTAKGVEDTAFYRYFPLASLNEVGGEPSIFGLTVDDFHAANVDRGQRWPHTMLATSTHDSKRSEDVRCRIDVLSEMPARWRLALRRWRHMNRAARTELQTFGNSGHAPSAVDEYLLYQTLLGTLPIGALDGAQRSAYADRLVQYMLKAAREAKVHTRWTHPDATYESALEAFVRTVLTPAPDNVFLDDLQALTATVAWFGVFNSLSLTLLKYTCPGVPDLYQGQEQICLTLVDPDNRGAVDYAALAATLDRLQAMDPQQAHVLLNDPQDGRAKLWLTWRLLTLRRSQQALLRDGEYVALPVTGAAAAHVVAFARRLAGSTLVVLAPRLIARLMGDRHERPVGDAAWADTRVAVDLADGPIHDVLTGTQLQVERGQIALAEAFAQLPVAALLRLRAW